MTAIPVMSNGKDMYINPNHIIYVENITDEHTSYAIRYRIVMTENNIVYVDFERDTDAYRFLYRIGVDI